MAAVRALILLLAMLVLPLHAMAALPVADLTTLAFDQHPGAALPVEAVLTDDTGRSVRLGAYFGGLPIVLVLEYFHCPNLCGLTMDQLFAGLDRTALQPGRDYELLAVSIDPQETAADAREARRQSLLRTQHPAAAADGWHFLTGSEGEVRRIAAAVGFPYRYDASIGQYAHPAGVTLLTPQGRVSRYLLGVDYPPEQIVSGLADAGRAQIAAPANPLLLLCYHYDPATGRYSLAVYRIVQAGAAATVLAMLGGLFVLKRRERR